MSKYNRELAKIFSDMAAIYELQGNGDEYRARAYENAARAIDNLPEDVSEIMEEEEKLEDIRNIGESIADKVREYIKTGKIEKYEELKKTIPEDFVDLLEIEGVGPETLKTLQKELNIKTKEDLVEALESGEVEEIKGFGEKTVQNILDGIAQRESAGDRILLADAVEIAGEIVENLKEACDLDEIEVVGSIRRRRTTIGDIDILVTAKESEREKIMDHFTDMDIVKKVVAKGKKKSTVHTKAEDRDVDLRIFEEGEFGAAMLYFTGSKAHNVHLRKMAQEKDWKINEYGLFSGDKKLAGKTEESIYSRLGLPWIPPEMRGDNGEIEAAEKDELPDLVSFDDIHGDLHMHSTWSDGNNSIEELVEFVRENFDYDYIVITDHSKSQTQAGGLDEDELGEQYEEIEKLNDKIGSDFIKKGVEVDILPDGSLDLSDDFLKECDWVVASVHRRMNQDNTDRILSAMDNPYVNAIGHPFGRLIGKRQGYSLDFEKILDKASETGTALEINAQPARMDLEVRRVRAAIDAGVMLVLGTDTHNLGSFINMRFGVGHARRGWATADDILNTRKWKEVQKFVEQKR